MIDFYGANNGFGIYDHVFSGYVEEEDDFSELYEEEPIGLEDMLLEFERMQKKTKQELQEMEKRALKAEKQTNF